MSKFMAYVRYKPPLSIVIPTYNRQESLVRAVKSALEGSPSSAEVIVVDDFSETPASEVLASVCDERLRVVLNKRKKGASGARNFGVDCANGELVLFLDDDDCFVDGYIGRVLKVAASLSSDAFGSSAVFIENADNSSSIMRKIAHTGIVKRRVPIRLKIVGLGMGFWITRSLFNSVGGVDDELKIDEDTDLCVRLFAQGATQWYEGEPGVRVARTDEARLTNTVSSEVRKVAYARTFLNNQSRFPFGSRITQHLINRAIRATMKDGDTMRAKQLLGSTNDPIAFGLGTIHYALRRIKVTSRQ